MRSKYLVNSEVTASGESDSDIPVNPRMSVNMTHTCAVFAETPPAKFPARISRKTVGETLPENDCLMRFSRARVCMPSATAPTPTATHRIRVKVTAGMYQLTVISVTESAKKASGATMNAKR